MSVFPGRRSCVRSPSGEVPQTKFYYKRPSLCPKSGVSGPKSALNTFFISSTFRRNSSSRLLLPMPRHKRLKTLNIYIIFLRSGPGRRLHDNVCNHALIGNSLRRKLSRSLSRTRYFSV